MPLLRLILIIIFVLLRIFFRSTNMSLINYDMSFASKESTTPKQFSFLNLIKRKIRRFFAVRKVKKFITKYDHIYSLKNRHMTLIYDDKKLEITCIDRVESKSKTIISQQDYKYSLYNVYDDSEENFKREFDNICSFFSEYTTCDDIIKVLEWNYYIKASKPLANDKKTSQQKQLDNIGKFLGYEDNNYYDRQYIKPEESIDINSADEEELSKLPGINIILAKKIIDYRNLNNGFKSKEEFFEKMKIKPHFQEQLDNLILIGAFEWSKEITLDNERTIDF